MLEKWLKITKQAMNGLPEGDVEDEIYANLDEMASEMSSKIADGGLVCHFYEYRPNVWKLHCDVGMQFNEWNDGEGNYPVRNGGFEASLYEY